MVNEKYVEYTKNHFSSGINVFEKTIAACVEDICKTVDMLVDSFSSGNKLLICGNGGSAADAQHMAAELVNSLSKDLNRPGIPAIALTTDTSIITAYSNDYGYVGVFGRQVEALGNKGDVLIGISTSGNSKNVIDAVEKAKIIGMKTIGLIGEEGKLSGLVDCEINVPSTDTQHIQENHLIIEHIICGLIEQELFEQGGSL